MDIREVVLPEERKEIERFLRKFHLSYEDDIDVTLSLHENDTLIATASAADNIVKCVAVESEYQHKNHLGKLMSALIKTLNQKGIDHTFAYTRPEHLDIFKSLGFHPIVQTMNLTFLERNGNIKETLNSLKEKHNLKNDPKGSVVINANPLTKGHLHLIEEARKHHEILLVFVVSEDRSFFPFADRLAIIEEALKDKENVVVLPTGDYLVSFATFPKYFQKHEESIREEHALIDVLTFKQHYMKIFNITDRYVGKEPYSAMTDTYNETMKRYLRDGLHIIERKTHESNPISASTVRKLLRKNGLEAVRPYVPEATYQYLQSEKGQKIIEDIKTHDKRH